MKPPVPPVTAVGNRTIADLQALSSRYSQAVYELSNKARTDYQALQAAIKLGNVADGEVALARLELDRNIGNSPPAAQSSTAASPVDGNSDQGGITGAQTPTAKSLDTSA
jgi:hypothetical protein